MTENDTKEETQPNLKGPATNKTRDLLRYIDKLEDLVYVLWTHAKHYERAKGTMQVMEGVLQAQNSRISELITEISDVERRLVTARYRIASLENQKQYLEGRVV